MATDTKTTVDPNEALSKVFSSLQRAGDHWQPGGTLTQTEKGYEAVASLRTPLPKDSVQAVREYIKDYLRELGWKARVSASRTQVRIALSRA